MSKYLCASEPHKGNIWVCRHQSQESWQPLPSNTPTQLLAHLLHLPIAEGKSPCHGLPAGIHKPWLSPVAQQCNLFMNGSGTPRLNYEAGIQSGRMCSCFLTDWRIKRAIEYILSFHMTASPSSPLPSQETSRVCTWREEDLQCSGPTRIRERFKRTCIQKTTLLYYPQQKNYLKAVCARQYKQTWATRRRGGAAGREPAVSWFVYSPNAHGSLPLTTLGPAQAEERINPCSKEHLKCNAEIPILPIVTIPRDVECLRCSRVWQGNMGIYGLEPREELQCMDVKITWWEKASVWCKKTADSVSHGTGKKFSIWCSRITSCLMAEAHCALACKGGLLYIWSARRIIVFEMGSLQSGWTEKQ